jgi:hypothetical protein
MSENSVTIAKFSAAPTTGLAAHERHRPGDPQTQPGDINITPPEFGRRA